MTNFGLNNRSMKNAVISGDIVASTSLTDEGRMHIEEKLNELLGELHKKYKMYGRMIKGDYLECVVPDPVIALRLCLIIKAFIKSISGDEILQNEDNRFKFFKIHGIRLAIGYGELTRFDPAKGIIDGEAIYLSGRRINEELTYNKERIVIKSTLFFVSGSDTLNREIEPLLALIDVLLSKATAKQCEVLYMKLMNLNEETIAAKMNIAQPVVNQHSTSVGWNAIEKAVIRFADVIKTASAHEN
jgi:hypothetical protein